MVGTGKELQGCVTYTAEDTLGCFLFVSSAKILSPPSEVVPLHNIMWYGSCHYLPWCTVIKATVLLADINDFERVNAVYAKCEFCL